MSADRILIEIGLGNAAMLTPSDVVLAIRKSIGREAVVLGLADPLEAGDGAPIRDENGNTVGSWRVE